MNKFVKALIWVVAIFAVAFVGGAFWHGGGEFVVEGLFSSYEIWLIFFLGLALVSIPKLKHVFDLGSGGRDKEAGMGKTKDGQKLSQYYDVRFIFVRPVEDYLRVEELPDYIDAELNEVYDINGWDLKKFCKQLFKSNPVIFEWANSPIV